MNDTTQGTDRPAGEPVTPPPQAARPGGAYPAYVPPVYWRPHYPRASTATTVLVLGILSVALGWPLGFLGIIAWTMGNTELREIDAGLRPPDGRGMARAGRICGIVGTCLFGTGCVCGVLWLGAWSLIPALFERFR